MRGRNATEVLNILQKANGSDGTLPLRVKPKLMPCLIFDFQRVTTLAVGRSVAPSHRCAKAGAHQKIPNPADPHLFGHHAEI